MDDFETLHNTSTEGYEPEASEEAESKGLDRSGGRRRFDGSIIVATLLGVAGVLILAFALRTSEPRELPFPGFEAQAPFPELAERHEAADEADSPAPSRFEAALQRGAAPPEEPGEEPPPRRAVPLGGDLVGEVPTEGGSWRWSTESGATLIVHQPPGGRPDALVFAEAFAERMAERPTAEIHRFRVTVDPAGDGGSPFLGTLLRVTRGASGQTSAGSPPDLAHRARLTHLLATRTLGRGLGFAAGEDGFTGWRWVGRNEHRVVIRLARWEGTWSEQRPLPAELAQAVRDAVAADRPAVTPDRLARVPAHLFMGSAAEPVETSGAHLAILCARTPDCPVAEELAAFLGSIRTERPGLVERLLREGVQEPFHELAASAGLELHEPTTKRAEESEPQPQKASL